MIFAKELRQQRASLIENARVFIDKKNPTAEDNAKFDAMMDEADKLKAKIDRIERADDAERHLAGKIEDRARRGGISTDQAHAEAEAESSAFRNYMRYGMNGLNEDERRIVSERHQTIQNAQSVGTGSSGGYTVPTGFYRQLIDAQLAYGGMINVANVIDTDTGNALPIPTDNDTSQMGAIIGENTQVSTQDVTFGSVSLGAYMYTSKAVLVSVQLLQDSAFGLESFLSEKLATRIARITNAHFTTGTGTSQPTGVVTAATLGKTGTTGQTTTITYDDLVDLEHSVDPAYRTNARFMMNDSSLKVIKKLKDSMGRPLWLPGMAAKEPDRILDHAYEINQQMPIMAASAKSVLFGDFSNYFIRRVANPIMMRLSEKYADYGQVGFILWQRFDGNLVDAGTHPITYYQNAAS